MDYHRFHFPLAGTPSPARLLPGPLYSVSPVSLGQDLSRLWRNKRMITRLDAPGWGEALLVEFGATNVGSIRQTYLPGSPVRKGQEKGCFSFGASAVMTLLEPDRVRLSPDLVRHSAEQRETYARMGDTMGTRPARPEG